MADADAAAFAGEAMTVVELVVDPADISLLLNWDMMQWLLEARLNEHTVHVVDRCSTVTGSMCLQRPMLRAARLPTTELRVGIWVRIASMDLSPGDIIRRPPILLTAKHSPEHQFFLV